MDHPSPLRYPGGKHALAPLLADILASNDLHDGTFVEPFAGGAGAALGLMFGELVSEIVLNDVDPRIYAFWRAVVNQTDQLISRVRRMSVTMRTWRRCRRIYDGSPSRHRQLDLAFATLFLNRCSRSGILMGSGPIGGYAQDGTWKLDARFNRRGIVHRIKRVAAYRDRVTVTRLDAKDVLKSLPNSTDRMLVYLDPPYYKKGQRLYMNAMQHSDHEELARFLLADPPFNWVLTYDNAKEVRRFYRKLRPRAFELCYSAYKRRTGSELIVFDPRLNVPRELLLKHNRQGCLSFSRI